MYTCKKKIASGLNKLQIIEPNNTEVAPLHTVKEYMRRRGIAPRIGSSITRPVYT
jgi:hypothetical protein